MAINSIILASLVLLATTAGIYFMLNDSKADKIYLRQFMEHNKRHNKRHANNEEMEFRYAIYANNKKKIEKHNASGKSFTMAENKFTDMTFEEFKSKYLSSQVLQNKRISLTKEK